MESAQSAPFIELVDDRNHVWKLNSVQSRGRSNDELEHSLQAICGDICKRNHLVWLFRAMLNYLRNICPS
jgi:hypothetical protein